jgi:hypothetical protein
VKVPDQPIASAPASLANVQLEVYVLKRSGANIVTLVGALYNTGTSKVQIGTQLGEDKIAGYNVGAVSLVDGVNLKQYLTFRTGNDSATSTGCLCSRTDDAFTNGILAGQRWYFTALFPAPAPNVSTVTVNTPIGAVPNVTISNG